ncbi:hypothetical protein QBC34DRAFT_214392 [Podospora aff. communis PSN243]|uniref:Uncharacterized protein n=1 Tax=Podospora aff. communis PSN243 TaxID=3040156 RepID=A0AAV9G4R6_9PEZI|nr:hypothetical protein QBC34DRAFT_214392 [Podospora aff. communis PSN243]
MPVYQDLNQLAQNRSPSILHIHHPLIQPNPTPHGFAPLRTICRASLINPRRLPIQNPRNSLIAISDDKRAHQNQLHKRPPYPQIPPRGVTPLPHRPFLGKRQSIRHISPFCEADIVHVHLDERYRVLAATRAEEFVSQWGFHVGVDVFQSCDAVNGKGGEVEMRCGLVDEGINLVHAGGFAVVEGADVDGCGMVLLVRCYWSFKGH